jgi:hypothetical protein
MAASGIILRNLSAFSLLAPLGLACSSGESDGSEAGSNSDMMESSGGATDGGVAGTGGDTDSGTGASDSGGTSSDGSGGGSTGGANSGDSCLSFPAVKVDGDQLVLNDGTDERYFLAGMVDNRPSSGKQLHRYDHDEMETQLLEHVSNGGTAMRWNAFLKGADLTWDASGHVSGVQPGSLEALRDGLDLAQKHGILLQIVLTTAHFLRFGSGGEGGSLNTGSTSVPNALRVANNEKMFTENAGTQAYIDNVIIPMTQAVGAHPALLGYVISNEGYGMTTKSGSTHGVWSDQTIEYTQLLQFVNKVAGELNRRQPGVILSVSTIPMLKTWFEDAELIAAGGDSDGTLHVHQYQYYPENHRESYSPFLHDLAYMDETWGGTRKPTIAGEFPIEGLAGTTNNPTAMTLLEGYDALFANGYSGGFTWSNLVYTGMSPEDATATDAAYTWVADDLLAGLSLADRLCEPPL